LCLDLPSLDLDLDLLLLGSEYLVVLDRDLLRLLDLFRELDFVIFGSFDCEVGNIWLSISSISLLDSITLEDSDNKFDSFSLPSLSFRITISELSSLGMLGICQESVPAI